jgi:pimeloyl-ACP methyl ester carboxylesterase
MNLFVRESGSLGAPAIIFLHGGTMSGWSWEPVVQRMQGYHCLVPDLTGFGKSSQHGPFEMGRAADAVAEVIRSRVGSGRAHIVGWSLGAQVGVQLVATEPKLVDRAVLCGTVINTMPYVRLTRFLLGLVNRNTLYRRVIKRYWNSHLAGIPAARIEDYREDVRVITDGQLAHIVVASAGFTMPEGLDKSDSPALFLTGAEEMPAARRWAATLARQMPNAVDRVAIGMHHDWPVHYPDLFSRTVDGWLTDSALPSEIAPPTEAERRNR